MLYFESDWPRVLVGYVLGLWLLPSVDSSWGIFAFLAVILE
jgi:hypothetical protein